MYGERCQELGRNPVAPAIAGRSIQSKKRTANAYRNSDQFIVLRGRESRLHGEGIDGYT